MKGTLFLLPALFIFAGCSNVYFMSAEKLYERGVGYVQSEQRQKAHRYFSAAAQKQPDPLYDWAAAQTAPNRVSAQLFAWRAWEAEFRNREILFFLLSVSGDENERDKISYGLELLNQLPQSQDKDLLKGEIYLDYGQVDSAHSIWNRAMEATPRASLANAIGRLHLVRGQYDSLIPFLENAASIQVLDNSGYSLLAFALSHCARYNEAESVLQKALRGNANASMIYHDLAWINMLLSNNEQALGYLHRASRYYIPTQSNLAVNLSILRALIYRKTSDTEKLQELRDTLLKHPARKTEYTFVDAMIRGITNDITVLKTLDSLRAAAPNNPLIDLAAIDEYLRFKKNEKANRAFARLPVHIQRFPSVLQQYAATKASVGELDDALRIVRSMHTLGAASEETLKLRQQITFRLRLDDVDYTLQDLFENNLPEKIDDDLNEIVLLLRTKRADSALIMLDNLTNDFPLDNSVTAARIQALFAMNDYDQVINEIDINRINIPEIKVFKARAQFLLEETERSIETYRQTLENSKKPYLYLEFAELLTMHDMYAEAAVQYRMAADILENHLPNTEALAFVLGKSAWFQFKSGKDLNLALRSVEKAYKIEKTSVDIINTYASVLAGLNQHTKAIVLLSQSIENYRHPMLLYRLGKIYYDTGRSNRAKDLFAELAQIPDSILSEIHLTREELEGFTNIAAAN